MSLYIHISVCLCTYIPMHLYMYASIHIHSFFNQPGLRPKVLGVGFQGVELRKKAGGFSNSAFRV